MTTTIGSCASATELTLMPGTPARLSAVVSACDAALLPLPMAFTAACRADTATALLGMDTCRLTMTDSSVVALYDAVPLPPVAFNQPRGGGDGGGDEASCTSRRWR